MNIGHILGILPVVLKHHLQLGHFPKRPRLISDTSWEHDGTGKPQQALTERLDEGLPLAVLSQTCHV